ncbi:MAG: hypothetical protein H0W39_01055 [Sphingomonas sp.]|nr:hypothetical protein [Sphingomonas sp.]
MEKDIIKGDDGRVYRRRENGSLTEVFDAAAHAKRQASAITAKHTITGVRLVDLSKPDDPAVVVTLDEKEAKGVVQSVSHVLKARQRGSA